jgi:hypothetical protein
MKILSLIAVAVTVMAFSACSSSKKSAQVDPEYAAWLAQRQQSQDTPRASNQETRTPRETERTLDKCIKLAIDKTSTNLRAYGEAKSFDESAATDVAIMTAQERMANLLNASMQTVSKKYVRNAKKNIDITTENLFQSLSKRFSDAEISNTRVIEMSIYDVSNGQVHVYVCIEANAGKPELSQEIANVLSDGGVEGIKEHQAEFEREIAEDMSNRQAQQQ